MTRSTAQSVAENAVMQACEDGCYSSKVEYSKIAKRCNQLIKLVDA